MELPTPVQLFASAPQGPAVWEQIPTSRDFPEDEWSPDAVEAKGQENSVGNLDILAPEEFVPKGLLNAYNERQRERKAEAAAAAGGAE